MQLHAQVYSQEAVTILLKPNKLKEASRRQKGIGTNQNRQLSNKNRAEKEAENLLEETGESTKLKPRIAFIFPTSVSTIITL